MRRCVYCGDKAPPEDEPHISCCGEVHFEDAPDECPKCGSEDTYSGHQNATPSTDECDFWNCGECGHVWNIG